MGRPTPHVRNAAICQAVANGAQLSELAAQHGITPQSIRLVLKKAGQIRQLEQQLSQLRRAA